MWFGEHWNRVLHGACSGRWSPGAAGACGRAAGSTRRSLRRAATRRGRRCARRRRRRGWTSSAATLSSARRARMHASSDPIRCQIRLCRASPLHNLPESQCSASWSSQKDPAHEGERRRLHMRAGARARVAARPGRRAARDAAVRPVLQLCGGRSGRRALVEHLEGAGGASMFIPSLPSHSISYACGCMHRACSRQSLCSMRMHPCSCGRDAGRWLMRGLLLAGRDAGAAAVACGAAGGCGRPGVIPAAGLEAAGALVWMCLLLR